MHIRSCIFDLDGVIIDSPKYHFIAWRRLANALGFDISNAQNEQLKGVCRRDTIELILNWGNITLSEKEIIQWMDKKNQWYLEMTQDIADEFVLPGVISFIEHLRNIGIQTAIGSASRNARIILKRLQIEQLFDHIVDGNNVTHSKPHPETFLKAIQGFNITPNQGIVFEDSNKGIESAKNGGFFAVGVGDANTLINADVIIQSFQSINFSQLVSQLFQSKSHSEIIS